MSHLKQKHKDYLTKNEIKDLTDLVNYVEILRNTPNLKGEDRQMLFDFAFLITNEQLSLKSFFAENFRQELYNQLGITNDSVNVKSSDSCFTKTSDIVDEISKIDKNTSQEFFNAFKKFAENEDRYERVRANFYGYLNDNTPTAVGAEFDSLEGAKIFFKNSPTLTEAFYYTYTTSELLEKEEKVKPIEDYTDEEIKSPLTFMDEVIGSLESKEDLKTETRTEEPNFILGWGFFPKRGKIITYNNPTSCKDVTKTGEIKVGKKESQTVKKAPIFTFCKQMKNAIEEMAFRTEYGHNKYIEFDADYNNFARVDNGDEEYGNAQFRHALGIGDDSELEHYVASAWDAVARLEIYLRNKVK